MRREEWVTVQGPVKEQQPDGMSPGGGGKQRFHAVLFATVKGAYDMSLKISSSFAFVV